MERGRIPDARDRVHAAIKASVDAAETELEELRDAEPEERLATLISGWGRGLGAALEELAVAVDELARLQPALTTTADEAEPVVVPEPEESSSGDEEPERGDASETQLIEEAKRSRAATAEVRREGETARRELPDEQA